MRIIKGTAAKGPGIGSDKAVMGHAWWYWSPTVAWMDWQMTGGRMRGLQMQWLCFFCDLCHFTKEPK